MIERKRKNKDSTKDFHAIASFPDNSQKQPEVKLSRLAFGTNHGAGLSEDRLLYTWGHNQCQQLGVSLKKYGDDVEAAQNKNSVLGKLYETAINTTLLIPNKQKQNEEALTGGQAQKQKDIDQDSDDERGEEKTRQEDEAHRGAKD